MVYSYFAKQEDLASEVARKKGTFAILKASLNSIDFSSVNTFLISESDLNKRLKSYKVKETENIVKAEVINKIMDFGVNFWDGILLSDDVIKHFDKTKVSSILKKLLKQRAFTKQNLVDAIDVINKIEELNISVSDVSALSNIKENSSKYSKEAIVFFSQLTEQQLKDIITLGRSGNQKIIDVRQVRMIESIYKEVQKGRVPNKKNLDSVFPNVLTINRKFKIVKI